MAKSLLKWLHTCLSPCWPLRGAQNLEHLGWTYTLCSCLIPWNTTRWGKGQPLQQALCSGRRKAVLWFHFVPHEHWCANCLAVLALLTQERCLSLQGGSMECTAGKGQGKGSTGAHHVPAAWWSAGDPAGPGAAWPGPVSSVRLPWSCNPPWEHCAPAYTWIKRIIFLPQYQVSKVR